MRCLYYISENHSVFDLFYLGLRNVPHLRTGLAWFERCKHAVGPRQLDVGWHVRVGTGKRVRLDSVGGKLGFQSFALHALFAGLSLSLCVTLNLFQLGIGLVCGWHALVEVLKASLKKLVFLFLLLLQLEHFGLEHGQFRNSCKHLAREFSCSGFVFVDLLGNLERGLATIKSLGPELLSQVADFFIDQFLLEERFLLIVQSLLEHLNLCLKSRSLWVLATEVNFPWVLFRILKDG